MAQPPMQPVLLLSPLTTVQELPINKYIYIYLYPYNIVYIYIFIYPYNIVYIYIYLYILITSL